MRTLVSISLSIVCIVFLWKCKPDDEKQEWYLTSIETLNGCKVNSIVVDKYGNKWFATSKGLAVFSGDNWNVYVRSSETGKNKVSWLATWDNNGLSELLLATDFGVSVLTFNDKMNIDVTDKYNTDMVDLLSDTVNRIAVGRGNDVWFLTNKGVSLYDNVWYIETGENSLDFIPVKSALMPSTGSYYCGRQRSGMIKFDYSEVDGISGATEWIAPYNGIILDTVNFIYKSTSGELWLACFGNQEFTGQSFPKDGLIKHIGNDSKSGFTYFNHIFGGLANNRIHYIDESNDGKIWLATEGGISYQINDTLFGNYSVDNSLANNKVYCLAFDLDGSLWCGTQKGISHFKDGVFTNYFNE